MPNEMIAQADNLRKIGKWMMHVAKSIHQVVGLQSTFVRVALLPVALGAIGILCLSLKPNDGFWSEDLGYAMGAYFCLALAKVILEWRNAIIEGRRASRTVSLKNQIKGLDSCVEQKLRSMKKAIDESDGIPTKLLLKARRELVLKNAVTQLNTALQEAVCDYLDSVNKLRDANFVSCVLQPDENGQFVVVGEHSKTGGDRATNTETGIYVGEKNTTAGYLWEDKGSIALSYSSTLMAAEDSEKHFKFLYEVQKTNLKSIFCYRIDDLYTDTPLAIWSMDADQEDVFPNAGDPIFSELIKIMDSFAKRFALEVVYDKILTETEGIYQGAIDNNKDEQLGGL